jgi:hypothetical protein
MTLPSTFVAALRAALGEHDVLDDLATLGACSVDALGRGHAPDLVVRPADTAQVAAVAPHRQSVAAAHPAQVLAVPAAPAQAPVAAPDSCPARALVRAAPAA